MPPASKALSIFLNMDDATVARDVAAAVANADANSAWLESFNRKPPRQRTPEDRAQAMHRRLLQARAIHLMADIHEDERLFRVLMAAEAVAEEATYDASKATGQIQALESQMAAIRTQAGLDEDDDWDLGEGPPHYEALRQVAETLYEKITTTVLVETLSRYGFDDIADLVETNPMLVDVRREAGRQAVMGADDDEAEEDLHAYLSHKWGPRALDLLAERVQSVRDFGQD